VTSCGPDDHCITCGDVAVGMRVVRFDASNRLAWCSPAGRPGAAGEWVDTELAGDVRPGDLVLVHAGTALARLEPPEEGAA
jgi:hydrogenase maturation factor